jgi:hypothetical protein
MGGRPHSPVAVSLLKNRGTRCLEGWVGPTAGLGVLEKSKTSCPNLELNCDSLAGQPLAQSLSGSIRAPSFCRLNLEPHNHGVSYSPLRLQLGDEIRWSAMSC